MKNNLSNASKIIAELIEQEEAAPTQGVQALDLLTDIKTALQDLVSVEKEGQEVIKKSLNIDDEEGAEDIEGEPEPIEDEEGGEDIDGAPEMPPAEDDVEEKI